jgi:predicted dehydrogenase
MMDLREGYQVQRVIDACARSSASGRWVAVA